jgi:hypothetical protein
MKYDKTWSQIRFNPMLRKLNSAKEYLRSNWVLHPDYEFTERHRNSEFDADSQSRVLFDVKFQAKLGGRI